MQASPCTVRPGTTAAAHSHHDCVGALAMWPRTETNAAAKAACSGKHSRIIAGQERWRWDLNPRKGCPFTRFRGLRSTIHHGPPEYVNCVDACRVTAGERLRTGVNETETETRPGLATGRPMRAGRGRSPASPHSSRRSAVPQKFRSGNAARNFPANARTASRPRSGACSEYSNRMSGAASSSMTAGLKSGPQNSVNQRPTMALFSSADHGLSFRAVSSAPFGAAP